MSDLIGDTAHLHRNVVSFSAVHSFHGAAERGSFLLTDCSGFNSLANSRASVRIVSTSLTAKVIGPSSADRATSGVVAVIPADEPARPNSRAQMLSIGGHAYVEHSVYCAPTPVSLRFSADVAHQIKPKPLVGSAPRILYDVKILGGDTKDETCIVISGDIEVDGIGFVKSW